MKIQLMSDLHVGHKHKHLPKLSSEADVLVIAGDISSNYNKCYEGIEKVVKGATLPIVFVLGNHDYYGNSISGAIKDFRNFFSTKSNYHFMEKDKVSIDGVNFVGTTLWTDLDKGRGATWAQFAMPDYPNILKSLDQTNGQTIDTQDTIDAHNEDMVFLKNNVKKGDIVISHHIPSYSLVAPQYIGNSLTSAFAVDLDNFILDNEPAFWFFGHTHTNWNKKIGNTVCVCNPFGYPFEMYKQYKEETLVEI